MIDRLHQKAECARTVRPVAGRVALIPVKCLPVSRGLAGNLSPIGTGA